MKKLLLFSFCLSFVVVNSLYSQDKTWVGGGVAGVWEDAANWSPAGVPSDPADDVLISGAYSVTISSNPTIESLILSGTAHLTIAENKTLTVSGNGGDGVSLSTTGTTLTVQGTLISSDHGSDGIDINEGDMTVAASGIVIVEDVGNDGMELNDNLTNDGSITITNPGVQGIDAKGSNVKFLTNNGTITISGGEYCLDGSNTWYINNYGTFSFSGADVALHDDGTNFNNYGTFIGEGNIENGNGNDLVFKSGSTLKPGLSVGQLHFEESLNLSNTNLDIEINGASNYDQIVVDTGILTPGTLTITNAILNLSGSYTPVPGDEFMILEKTNPGAMIGTFSGLPEGAILTYKGVNMVITYSGGDGNDMAMIFDSFLPVELIEFSARAMESDVKLSWVTATETNNDYFTIERSRDGRSFENLGIVFGKGNSTVINEYSFMDNNPLNGMNYYRLKQTDFDGQFSYSEIETVEFGSYNAIKVYPTIVADVVTIETGSDLETDLTIIIRDLTGKEYSSFVIPTKSNRKDISLGDLRAGHYFITIYNNETIETHKFIKL